MSLTLSGLAPRSAPTDHARHIERWLLSDEVIRIGPPALAGGIVNYIVADGSWDGIYPEICGYHLQFLAAAAPPAGPPEASDHGRAARRVIAWLAAEGHDGSPLTLYRRDAALSTADWRNRCLFAFDLAIILRGFAMAETRWPGIVPGGVQAAYAASVRSITAAGRLASHHLRDGGMAVEVPVKWSTTPGVHHVKAAAALAGTGDPTLASIALATARDEAALLGREGRARMQELHPFLYLIEGWLTLWGQSADADHLRRAADAFAVLHDEFDCRTAELPPVAGGHGAAVRADVLAQALRAGLVLDAAGALVTRIQASWPALSRGLRDGLVARIAPAGGVEFDGVRRDRNSWASMFTWQALRFWDEAKAGRLNAKTAAAVLI
jgi:hypothetical protein